MDSKNRKLAGRVCLVTGSGKGIGAAIVRAVASEDVAVAIHYHTSRNEAQALCLEIQAEDVRAIIVGADLQREQEVIEMFATIENQLGSVDFLVNNAGVSLRQLVQDTSEAQWERVINTNLKAAFLCCRQAVPAMIQKKYGRIINIASAQGVTGASYESVYAASKGGMITFSKSLGHELGPSGITVNALAPGPVASDMLFSDLDPAEIQELTQSIPLGRVGKPQDIAGVCRFLLSPAADYINGQVIGVDGGWA